MSKILVVEDDLSLREALCETLNVAGYETIPATDGEHALTHADDQDIRLVISDVQMSPIDGVTMLSRLRKIRSDLPVIMMTAYGNVENAVTAMQMGAVDYLAKPFDADVLTEKVEQFLPKRNSRDFIVVDPLTLKVQALAKKVAACNATVMLTGESGVGKEVFARFIHQGSLRSEQPFVAINCAAIPRDMLEATLFGFRKGAFTGAHTGQIGKFEQAQGGTLLLDEISEMDLGLQAKLLRVLQEKELEPLGDRRTVKLDVRVIATSNKDLVKAVEDGQFREDLYYRLNVFPLHIPALRERPKDIIPLAKFFLQNYVEENGCLLDLDQNAESALMQHLWTGNVRELANVIQRAAIIATGRLIQADDLCLPDKSESSATVTRSGLGRSVKAHEREKILQVLASNFGNRQDTAEQLGISPRTLRYKLAKFRDEGVRIPGESPSAERQGVTQ